ncbi:MAG: hypothetical protein V4565_05000 [Bacteroidota bacterium]
MKLLNIFKKSTKKVVKSTIQPLDKKQLEKVLGGATEAKLVDFLGRPHS